MTAPVLETVGLEKKFGGLAATSNVSLKVEKGARHALIGPNGAGKTTLINLLTGVLRPTAGRILLDERDITALAAAPPRQARHRPHLPDQPAVRRPDAAGDRQPGGLGAAGCRQGLVAPGRQPRAADGRGGRDPGELPPHRRDGRAHRHPALRQAAAARDRRGGRQQAARAAARRAGRRRARGRAARDPRHRRGAAGRRHRCC